MFETQKNFLPAQQTILARRSFDAAVAEVIVSSARRTASDAEFRMFASSSVNETIALFGEDGAAEFIGSGFRVRMAGRR